MKNWEITDEQIFTAPLPVGWITMREKQFPNDLDDGSERVFVERRNAFHRLFNQRNVLCCRNRKKHFTISFPAEIIESVRGMLERFDTPPEEISPSTQ